MAGNESQLSTLDNPYKRSSDYAGNSAFSQFIIRLKASYKNYYLLGFPWIISLRKGSHHHTIAPQKESRIILGAIPTKETQKQILRNKIRVSMLTADEESGLAYNKENGQEYRTVNIPLFDHSVIDTTTGKNITFAKFEQKIKDIKSIADNEKRDIYFHCMAGKSRSQVAIIAYFYLNDLELPKLTIADVKKNMSLWQRIKLRLSKKKTNTLQAEIDQLNTRLHNPMPSDIAKYIGFMRPNVKKLHKMVKKEADQAGFLGLLTLRKETRILAQKNEQERKTLLENAGVQIARNVGFILQTPLDNAFRDSEDKEQQEQDLVKLHKFYTQSGLNLLQLMVGADKDNYDQKFSELSPSSQARFAIIAQLLVDAVGQEQVILPEICNTPEKCAEKALNNIAKLSTGDQVELLAKFGEKQEYGLTYINVANKIASGSSMDQYNAGIKLAELFYMKASEAGIGVATEKIGPIITQQNLQEQYAFVMRLREIGSQENKSEQASNINIKVQSFAKELLAKNSDKPLTKEQRSQLQAINSVTMEKIVNQGKQLELDNKLHSNFEYQSGDAHQPVNLDEPNQSSSNLML